MVNAPNEGSVPWKFCRDCMNKWIQEHMLLDPTIRRSDEHTAR